jgi:serine acetyltransferase
LRKINRDDIPHLIFCIVNTITIYWYSFWSYLLALWWKILLGKGCTFHGLPCFRRHPGSEIIIAHNCKFLSTHASNLIGNNRPCIISTLSEKAEIIIGAGCGFSGTVIGSNKSIIIKENVRCGANTLITDTDWHTDDPRAGADAPIIIERNVWLGANVTVLKGVTIGENTMVGTGSLVTQTLPPNVVAAGSPARVIRPISIEEKMALDDNWSNTWK